MVSLGMSEWLALGVIPAIPWRFHWRLRYVIADTIDNLTISTYRNDASR
jgi:hypothetical protein